VWLKLWSCIGVVAVVGASCGSGGSSDHVSSTRISSTQATVTGTISPATGADALRGYLRLVRAPSRTLTRSERAAAFVIRALPALPDVRWTRAAGRLRTTGLSARGASEEIAVLPVPPALAGVNAQFAGAGHAFAVKLSAFAASLGRDDAQGWKAHKAEVQTALTKYATIARGWRNAVARYAATLHVQL